jgi:hypothetical protein
MDIGFELRGIPGRVSVTFAVNDWPELVGTRSDSVGFPMCHASVDYPARGYDAVLGWVQLVRSDDNASGGRDFEIDPLAFLGDVPHPFCWIGLEPQLFDSPSRDPRPDLDWAAHSFLCVPEDGSDDRLEVRALVGFSWGFRIRDEQIELVPPTVLRPDDWDGHVVTLADRYPAWRFVPGFRGESAPDITRS